MTPSSAGFGIDTALIFEDQLDAREAYAENLEEVGLQVLPQAGPVGKLKECLDMTQKPGQAALCDHFLNHRNYAQFQGAKFVKLLYKQAVPAVLCTEYRELVDDIRPFRRWIPALERPEDLDGERFLAGIGTCLREFDGKFEPERKPWRTQIKIAEIWAEEQQFFVEIPAWADTPVPLKFTGVPTQVLDHLAEDWRCRAVVNLGVETLADIYICDWELPA